MGNPLRDNIMAHICQLPYFKDFKYRKSDRRMIKKMPWGRFCIVFQMWQSWDREVDDYACEVIPIFTVRFDVLFKWFEKYTEWDLKSFRETYNLMFGCDDFGGQNSYLFLYDGSDFNKKMSVMQKDVIFSSDKVLSEYCSLEQMYYKIVEPLLDGKRERWETGANWIFEYLKLCTIVKPDRYYELKNFLLKIIDYLHTKQYPEPELRQYYDKLDLMFADLEQGL